jgi:hypothetical protein
LSQPQAGFVTASMNAHATFNDRPDKNRPDFDL